MEFHHGSHLTRSEEYCLKTDVQIRYIILCSNYWHEAEFPLLLHPQWIRTICSLLNLSHWEAGKYKTKTRTTRFWANAQCYKTSKINCWSVTYKKQPCFDIGLEFVHFTHFHDPFYTQALVRGANTHKYPDIKWGGAVGGRTFYQFIIWNFYFNTYIFYKSSEDINRNSVSVHIIRFNPC